MSRSSSRAVLAVAALLGALGCRESRAERVAPAAPAAAPRGAGAIVTFEGACDASGVVELDDRRFLVADDEDNVLRAYDAERGGPPLFELDPLRGSFEPGAESDLEAAARAGDHGFFLASHGRTAKGKRDADRLLLFATRLPGPARGAEIIGNAYRSLLDDVVEHPGLARFELASAAERAPKAPGGLNIEGLGAESDGRLLVGFRSPIPEGRALLVRIQNPDELLAGARAELSEPLLLDLGGLGVRALATRRSDLLILAGPSGDGGPFRLYRYDGQAEPELVPGVDLAGFGAEALFAPEGRADVLVLSDDGTRPIGDRSCKKLEDRSAKRFRGVWTRVPT